MTILHSLASTTLVITPLIFIVLLLIQLNVPLLNFFRTMAEIGNIDIELDPAISGNITYSVSNMPFDQLFDMVLTDNDLDKNIEGNSIRVFRKATEIERR